MFCGSCGVNIGTTVNNCPSCGWVVPVELQMSRNPVSNEQLINEKLSPEKQFYFYLRKILL